MENQTAKNVENEFPDELKYGSGLSITGEELVAQAALLHSVIGLHLNAAADNLHREPMSFPELSGLYDIAGTIYYALADNVYREEIEDAKAKGLPPFI